ncbi:hypothetical protein [Gillisia sp. Hel_I_29]|uniref:hypothetical protein n=1 Tax=Gillisia sp. Hel_I_29 TaxID=1249975 RepID=UPI00068A4361|nr:hypothetical protein [Gillisia sp. Hel_I_29]
MKISSQFFLILILLFGCKAIETNDAVLEEAKSFKNFRGFEPVDPTEFNDDILIVQDGLIASKDLKLLNAEETLGFLNNETVLVSIGLLTSEGKIAYIPFAISKKNTSYKVTMDYMKYATLGQRDERNNFIGYKRVGVGLRLISLITTAEAGINISDLYSIGLAAKAGKLSGTLMIEVIGIKSKDVTTLLPLPSEINQTTIQNAMQALATIKSKIYDADTKLYPQVMAIKVDIGARNQKIATVSANNNAPIVSAGMSMSLDDDKVEDLDDNSIKLQFQNNTIGTGSKEMKAATLERKALYSLLDKNVEGALRNLEECEQVLPGYHSVYEVMILLKKNRVALLDKEDSLWQEVYRQLLNNFSWRIPESIKKKLRDSTN